MRLTDTDDILRSSRAFFLPSKNIITVQALLLGEALVEKVYAINRRRSLK